jgi:hypothetical protein
VAVDFKTSPRAVTVPADMWPKAAADAPLWCRSTHSSVLVWILIMAESSSTFSP